MNRTHLGFCALALLAIGGIAYRSFPGDANAVGFAGGCIRMGVVLGALWLAWPQITGFLSRAPRWLLVASGIAIVVCVVKPILLLLAVPALALLWFFGPKLQTKADKPIIQQKRPRRRSNWRTVPAYCIPRTRYSVPSSSYEAQSDCL